MKNCQFPVLSFICLFILCGCAGIKGPVVYKSYENALSRNDIGIIRIAQKASLRILGCDNVAVPRTARYMLVAPGRHELYFSISGQTILTIYAMRNVKYIDVIGGHTYVLKSETGILFVGDKWFPEVVDVTDNPELHVVTIPIDEAMNNV